MMLFNGHDKYKPELNEPFYVLMPAKSWYVLCYKCVRSFRTLTIQICLYAVFIDFMCVFLYK